MSPLLVNLSALAAFAVVAIGPGLGLVLLLKLDRALPATLLPGAAMGVSVLLAVPLALAQLEYGVSGEQASGAWQAATAVLLGGGVLLRVVLALVVAVRRRRTAPTAEESNGATDPWWQAGDHQGAREDDVVAAQVADTDEGSDLEAIADDFFAPAAPVTDDSDDEQFLVDWSASDNDEPTEPSTPHDDLDDDEHVAFEEDDATSFWDPLHAPDSRDEEDPLPPRAQLELVAAVLVALVAGVVGFVVGGMLDGDSAYHAMLAEKLRELDDPSWRTVQMFPDTSPHLGYLIPAWHTLVAQAAILADVRVVEVMRSGSALVLFVAALAWAGLAESVLRVRGAAVAGAVGFVVFDVVRTSEIPMWGASVGMWPGSFGLWVVLPVILATLFALVDGRGSGWSADGARAAIRVPAAPRRALVVIALLTATFVVVHITYVTWIAAFAVSTAIAALVCGAGRMRRTWLALGVLLAMSAIVAGAITLLSHGVVGARGRPVMMPLAVDLDVFANMLSASGDAGYALDPRTFLSAGGIAIVGMLGVAVLPLISRGVGAAALALALVTSLVLGSVPALGDTIVETLGISHYVRVGQLIAFEIGIAALVVLVGRLVAGTARHAFTLLARLAVVPMVAAGVIATLWWEPLESRRNEPIVPEITAISVVGTAAGGAVLAVGVILIRRAIERRRGTCGRPAGSRRVALHHRIVALAAMLAVAAPAMVAAATDATDRFASVGERTTKRDALGRLDPDIIRLVEAAPSGDGVIALPAHGLAVSELAPVYVSAFPFGHVARTEANCRDQRLDVNRLLLTVGDPDFDGWRLAALDAYHASIVIYQDRFAIDGFFERHPYLVLERIDAGEDVAVRIDRDLVALAAARADVEFDVCEVPDDAPDWTREATEGFEESHDGT